MIPRIFCHTLRSLRSLRRAYSTGEAAKTPLDEVKKRDELRYGGLKSWDILTSERHAQDVRDVTQKPLWHAWQLAAASVVPLGLWLYLKRVETRERVLRTGHVDGQHGVKEQDGIHDGVHEAGTAASPAQLATSLAKLEQRLARIEKQLHARDVGR